MGQLVLVTGGARSGKSQFAERLVKESQLAQICYVATQSNQVVDEESLLRIAQHQAQRPNEWHTLEQFENLDAYFLAHAEYDGYLVDCLTAWVTNLFFDKLGRLIEDSHSQLDFDTYIEKMTRDQIRSFEIELLTEAKRMTQAIQTVQASFWVVTNEVGLGIVPENKLARIFRDYLGKVNQWVASQADEVYLVVAGIEMKVKPCKP